MSRLHIYPLRSAMHGAIEFHTDRWGYVCFKPPTRAFGRWWPWYFYVSPNATPWAATFVAGADPEIRMERRMAALRRVLWGHGYSTAEHDPQDVSSYVASFAGNLSAPEPEENARG